MHEGLEAKHYRLRELLSGSRCTYVVTKLVWRCMLQMPMLLTICEHL